MKQTFYICLMAICLLTTAKTTIKAQTTTAAKAQTTTTTTAAKAQTKSITKASAAPKQGFGVSGVVVDSITKEGEMYATLRITEKSQPNKVVRMAVTGNDGAFSETLNKAGCYVLSINSMGRKPIVREFALDTHNPHVCLDTLYICDDAKQLKGVEVVALKPLVKADIDKIEYNIEDDPDSKTTNILEMLRKVPMVTVDGDGNIKVNGSSNFKVYMNGRPNNMMSKSPKDMLKSMPATSIKKIEVITNPGPKYDAEGVGGILNIITVGKGLEGYTVSINTDVYNSGTSAGTYATIKKGKFTMSARYSYSYWDTSNNHTLTQRLFTGDPSTPSAYNSTNINDTRNYTNSHYGNIEASYDIDTLRLITASVGVWTNTTKANTTNSTMALSPLTQDLLYAYDNRVHEKTPILYIDGSIDYQRLFKLQDRVFTLSYKINGGYGDTKSYADYINRKYTDEWRDLLLQLNDQNLNSHRVSMEHTLQADYSTPIGKAHTIEVGAKYILRDNRANNDRYLRTSEQNADYIFDDNNSTHYRHENDIFAAYLGYGLKLGAWSARLGTRYEHTYQKVKYLLGAGKNFSSNFNDLVPSASLGYKINDEQNLRLAYNMRIWRPGIWCLNPYLDQSDPTSLAQGNPNLVSEKNHSLSLTYSYFATKVSTSWTFNHSFTNNSITQVSLLVNDNTIESVTHPTGKLVNYTTYRNIGKTQTTSLSGYVSWSVFKNTKLTMHLWGDYSDYNDRQQMHNYGWYGFVYANIQQTICKDWKISAGYSCWSKNPGLQSDTKGNNNYNVNLQKSFLKDRLSLSVWAYNFLESKRHYRNTINGSNFITNSDKAYNSLGFGISASIRLGELSAGVKRAQKSISNDDVKSNGGSGQGGK